MQSNVQCAAAAVRVVIAGALLVLTTPAAGRQVGTGEAPADKSGYHLFDPVPRALMRGLDTDRPDAAEGPYTIDAGHFQIEFSFAEFVYDHRNAASQTTRTWTVAPVVLRVGILNNTEIGLGFSPYSHTKATDRPTGASESADGFGDLTLGFKQNLWGNDGGEGGDTAFGIVGSVKFPTAADDLGNGKVEGAVGIALALSLPADFSLGLSTVLEALRSEDNTRYVADFTHAAVLSRELIADLAAYIEYAGSANLSHDVPYRAYFDAGLLHTLTPDIRRDAGVRVGLTAASDDLTFIAGMSVRF